MTTIPVPGGRVLIDTEDEYHVTGKIFLCNGYPAIKKDGRNQYIHRMIMNAERVRFVNGNRLDLRRTNLMVM